MYPYPFSFWGFNKVYFQVAWIDCLLCFPCISYPSKSPSSDSGGNAFPAYD